MKSLSILAKALDELGLEKEALRIYDLFKSAVPLVDFVPLSKWEPRGHPEEEDEEGNPIEREVEKIDRRKGILRSNRDRFNRDEREDLSNWFDSVKCLGDNIILIPFDREDVERNRDLLDGMGSIFWEWHPKDYISFKNKKSMIYDSNNTGDLDTLKEVFPSLWADIERVLISKDLNENEVVYMFYNQQTNPGRLESFSKDPFYFAHDLGHADFDSSDSSGEFKGIINEFLKEIGKLYVLESFDEDEGEKNVETAYEEISEKEESDPDYLQNYIDNFFNTTSGYEDLYGDVFAEATSGRLDIDIPDTLYLNKRYELLDENKEKAKSVAEKYKGLIMKYVNSKHGTGDFGSGPFSHFAGSVVLNDI